MNSEEIDAERLNAKQDIDNICNSAACGAAAGFAARGAKP